MKIQALWKVVAILIAASFLLSACSERDKVQNAISDRAENRRPYAPVNDVEFKNYDRRQQLADDPTAILWCTSSFSNPSSPMFTVPVVGKLTSGGKRPFPRNVDGDTLDSGGMYGESGEYRFGFTPNNIYADYYGMEVFCTNEPTVWQRQSTTIVMQQDPVLLAAHQKAREALKANNPQEAERILAESIRQIQQGR